MISNGVKAYFMQYGAKVTVSKGTSLCNPKLSDNYVYYLDKGVVSSLVVPNEFFMGYQCIRELAGKLNYYQEDDGRDTEVDFLSVTGENLYDRDTENILFPNIS